MKRKGTRVERELIDLLWSMGYAAVRVAGSGSSGHPSPDILAGKDGDRYAIEVKMRSNLPVYIEEEQIEELLKFSRIFGAIPCIAVKISRKGWRFLHPSHLHSTGSRYRIGKEEYEMGFENISDVCDTI